MNGFVNNQDKTTLEVMHVLSIMVKDLVLRLRKEMGPIVDLTSARNGETVAQKGR